MRKAAKERKQERFTAFCIPQILPVWEETRVFQQPLVIALVAHADHNFEDANDFGAGIEVPSYRVFVA
jgi:hypothetical protein